jgi:uncharacterized cupin superfamily protein
MKIISPSQGIFKKKEDGTEVIYQIFPEFEIHYNKLSPKTEQVWHHHEVIKEIICITSGEMEVLWKENGEIKSFIVKNSDTIDVENTSHTFKNNSDKDCQFIVFRFIPNGKDQRDVIKNDKVID